MEFQIKISQEAEKDLQTAKCFYRAKGIENQFDKEFLAQIAYLKLNPYLFQLYYRSVRKVHFDTFKYSIHYIIEKEEILILRVLHQLQFLQE
jgi:plasmid stabilization system protein ParE